MNIPKKMGLFEEKLTQLKEIVSRIESGNLNLDESLKKFEDGLKLSKECQNILKGAEVKVGKLVKRSGKLEVEELEL